jgi:hypothetical protein
MKPRPETKAHTGCSLERMVRRFRVSLEKILPDPEIRNPFLAFRTAESFENARCKVLVRTWELDAADEDEVRRLFEEVKRDGEPQVMGMKIRSIEEISPNIDIKHPI